VPQFQPQPQPQHNNHASGLGESGSARSRRALTVALVLNGVFLVIEAAVGFSVNSLALLSDAAHMLSDVGALALALGAAWLAARPAERSRTFGMRRAEVVGGFVNALVLLAACGLIAWQAINRLRVGAPEIAGLPVLIVGGIGLAINVGSAWALYRADSGNLNIRGALVHMMADALGSVGAMVAAGLIMAGFARADPIVSLFIAALVLWGTWGLLRDSTRVLFQFPPPHFDVEAMCQALSNIDGVASVHDVHVWTLDGQSAIVSAHVIADEGADLEAIRRRSLDCLEDRFSVRHATLQVEGSETPACHGLGCTPDVDRA